MEKIKKLQEVREKLKQDFIGILGFIDILKKYGENLDKDISTVAEMI